MKADKLPSLRYLEQCLIYESATQKLFWKARPRSHFKRQSDWRRFNNMFAGKQAFCTLSQCGYLYGVIGKKIYMTHRVIWKLVKRKEPPALIDHRDGVKANNAPANLRAATATENCRNRRKSCAVSGYKGVYPSHSRWMARIAVGKKRLYLGTFDSPQAASQVHVAASKKFFGEFAP